MSDSVWCIREASYRTCSYGIRTPAGVILVDAGMDSTGASVRELLAAMRQHDSDVRALLITHWHNDHAAGAPVTKARSGCSIHYDKAEQPWLSRQTARGKLRGWIAKRTPEWGIGVLLIGLLGEAVPEAVEATDYVQDGQMLLEDFEVISTPGHNPGHTSFYYRPERVLFAGDALAAIDDRVRFMARQVTLDLPAARRSMDKCLWFDIGLLCPSHRTTLATNVEQACDRIRDYFASGGKWPFLG